MPGSLQRRLILAAAICVSLALAGAAVSIGFVLHRFVRGQLDGHLDARITALVSQLRIEPDGRLTVRSHEAPPFNRRSSGWYWEVRRGDAVIGSPSLDGRRLDLPEERRRPRPDQPSGFIPADIMRRAHEPLILRMLTVPGGPGEPPTVFTASAPEEALLGPVLEALRTLCTCLGLIGVLLFAGVLLQVRLGLVPLRRLSEQLAEVRAGERARLPLEQPVEVLPLVGEINGLVDQNATRLAHARGHVANLAHGLKVPLSTLALAFYGSRDKGDMRLAALVEEMDGRVRHHLRRARTAAIGGKTRERVDLTEVVGDLSMVLARMHAEKAISFDKEVPAGFTVACDRHDVEEMLGNLIENACRWCDCQVRVAASREGSFVVILIEDDGPGLAPDDRAGFLQRGRRLDENEPGHGFGLPIALELAELYGGALEFDASPLGGLAVRLSLPN